jgi:hypothetical protein
MAVTWPFRPQALAQGAGCLTLGASLGGAWGAVVAVVERPLQAQAAFLPERSLAPSCAFESF